MKGSLAVRLAAVALIAVPLSLTVAGVHASHTLREAPAVGTNFLYPDLEPGGDQRLVYSPCDGANPPPAAWTTGVENWDAALPQWQFDRVPCTLQGTNTLLQWEDAALECFEPDPDNPVARACWLIPWSNSVIHGNHRDFGRTWILFDRVLYPDQLYLGQISTAAHEWGHNLSLAEEGVDQCAADTLMGSHASWVEPCYTGPSATDLASVRCKIYSQCGVATFYNYGGSAARIHGWLTDPTDSTVSGRLEYEGPDGWWNVDSGYSLSQVGDRMVMGDFDGDGDDDIATLYDYGSGAARIHVWLADMSQSVSNRMDYKGPGGWWSVGSGYTAGLVAGRMVSGGGGAAAARRVAGA